jgi:hypothetical protein
MIVLIQPYLDASTMLNTTLMTTAYVYPTGLVKTALSGSANATIFATDVMALVLRIVMIALTMLTTITYLIVNVLMSNGTRLAVLVIEDSVTLHVNGIMEVSALTTAGHKDPKVAQNALITPIETTTEPVSVMMTGVQRAMFLTM